MNPQTHEMPQKNQKPKNVQDLEVDSKKSNSNSSHRQEQKGETIEQKGARQDQQRGNSQGAVGQNKSQNKPQWNEEEDRSRD